MRILISLVCAAMLMANERNSALAQQSPPAGSNRVTEPGAGVSNDPEQPTHAEVTPIKIPLGNEGRLETIAMNRDGELIAAVTWLQKKPDATGAAPSANSDRFWDYWDEHRELKVLDGAGQVLRSIQLDGVVPLQMCDADDGAIFVGGEHRIARIDAGGQITHQRKVAELIENLAPDSHVSGMTTSDEFVFVAVGSGRSMRATEDIVRMKHDLTDAKIIIEQQFGCCSHIDLDVDGETLLVAENSRHRVNRFSFDGELQNRWGQRDRTGIEGFAACCNPVNFDMSKGKLITAESGIGRVKSFDPDGTFRQLVGYVDTTKFDRGSRLASMSCYIPVEVAPDGKRIYVMDVRAGMIRVLEQQ
tara:strand:- start:266008 stop:267087 length:1080 start_codon:yes stop_codon:yes gene_type:complete